MPAKKRKSTRKRKTVAKTITEAASKEIPNQAEISIGMIGHVDHGKSTLTKALTGKFPDTHSEEIRRGISIRLGYAEVEFRSCPDCQAPEKYTTQKECPICGKETTLLRRVAFVDEIVSTGVCMGCRECFGLCPTGKLSRETDGVRFEGLTIKDFLSDRQSKSK